MTAERTKRIRRERSLIELNRLSGSIAEWLDHRTNSDRDEAGHYVGRHRTQLETLRGVLIGAADGLRKAFQGLDESAATGKYMEDCRNLDVTVVWLERFWRFYADKFDQRDNATLKPILRAADEVVWSCHRELLLQAQLRKPGLAPGAAPLPYVAPEYSPAALDADGPLTGALEVPLQSSEWGDDLSNLVKSLPIPLLQLPPWAVGSPWWLVYIAHETGHFARNDLGLVRYTGEGLEAAVRPYMPESLASRWRVWSEEIFADAVSVALMGPWALWSIVEVEWSTERQMQKPKRKYPPPIVRLALMARMMELWGLNATASLRGFEIPKIGAAGPFLKPHLAAVEPAAKFTTGELPDGLGRLKDLASFSAVSHANRVQWWRDQLSGEGTAPVPAELATAREVTAGSLAAWAQLAAADINPEERAGAAKKLADRTKEVLAKSGPPGTRAGEQRAGVSADVGKELGRLLLERVQKLGREVPDGE